MFTKMLLPVFSVGMISASSCLAQPAANALTAENTFTANQLVTWVWERNSGIAAQSAAVDIAVHRISPAGSLDDPSISYSFAPRTFGRAGQGLNQKIEFAQQLPWPGTLKARKGAAAARATVARADEQRLRLKLAAIAKAAFAELYFVQRALAIHHETLELLRELKSVAETRYTAGKTSQQDVLQVELEIASLDRHLLELGRIEASVKAEINGLLSRDPVLPLPKTGPIPGVAAVPALSDLKRQALASHPELRRLEGQITASAFEVTVAEKAFYPDLRFIAGYNSLWDEADKRPIIGLSISAPLDRRKRRAELLGAKASVRRAELEHANQAAHLLSELARTHAGLAESVGSVALHERSLVPLAAEFLEAALADYESGTGAFLSVITAEQQKLQTEESLERSRADALRRFAELELWTGGPLTSGSENSEGIAP